MPLTRDEQAQLGQGRRLPRLGESAFLGIAVRDVQHKFRLDMFRSAQKRMTAFCRAKPVSLPYETGYASTLASILNEKFV